MSEGSTNIFFQFFKSLSNLKKERKEERKAKKKKGPLILSSPLELLPSLFFHSKRHWLSVLTDSITSFPVHISPCSRLFTSPPFTLQKGVPMRSPMDLYVDKPNGHFAALISLDFSSALDAGWPLSPQMLSSHGFPDTKLPPPISCLFLSCFLCRRVLLSIKCWSSLGLTLKSLT